MTALDQRTDRINELIDSCRETHETFRTAAQAAASSALKRLFGLYAQQRSRFAQELGDLARARPTRGATQNEMPAEIWSARSDAEVLQNCLARERSTLELYRKVLDERTLPIRAQFLVSAQLALLEQVHHRIETLAPDHRSVPARPIL